VPALLIAAATAGAATFTVTTGADSGAGSLREAISAAEANGNEPTGDLIQITYTGNIDLDSMLPEISTAMTISGAGASNLHIRRAPAATEFGLFFVNPAVANTVTIEGLTITAGSSGNGGGITKNGAGTLIINSVVMSDNHAPGGSGGAIYYVQGFTSIRNSTLSDNGADFGGAILGSEFGGVGGEAELVNSTVTGNQATSFGGGVYVGGLGEIEILSSTIQGNTADSDDSSSGDGGGIYTGADGTTLSVANTLLAGNVVGSSSPVPQQCASDLTSFGYNLVETDDSAATCTDFDQAGDIVGSPAMLGPLGGNGGPTPTFALLAGSPAIDTGNPATPGSAGFPICPATDQRGFFRTGAAGRCDIGAFELNAPATLPGGVGSGTTTSPIVGAPAPSAPPAVFPLAAAIRKCKKKFPKGPKRKKCIKRAKRRAQA
jgi:hypothetical protein